MMVARDNCLSPPASDRGRDHSVAQREVNATSSYYVRDINNYLPFCCRQSRRRKAE